jgi:hypothetical protein
MPSLGFLLCGCLPGLARAQASPFLTGASALEANILAWLTPVAIILVMLLGGMAMANRIVENCSNSMIFRCAASEGGGTARFASQLVGEREIIRTTRSMSRRYDERIGSITDSEQISVEPALLPSQIEQLPDLTAYLKYASNPVWQRVLLSPPRSAATERSACAPATAQRASDRDAHDQGGRTPRAREIE